jgi:hypothetical protein
MMFTKLPRAAYRTLLLAHPPSFRDEFGDEMQLIFEETTADRPSLAIPLLADCLVSALRQWFIGYQAWKLAFAMGYWFAFLVLILGLLTRRGLAGPLPH